MYLAEAMLMLGRVEEALSRLNPDEIPQVLLVGSLEILPFHFVDIQTSV